MTQKLFLIHNCGVELWLRVCPAMLHVFPCQWNFRSDHCMYSQNCMEDHDIGVKVMHGNRGVYHKENQPAFKVVYEAIRDYRFQDN